MLEIVCMLNATQLGKEKCNSTPQLQLIYSKTSYITHVVLMLRA